MRSLLLPLLAACCACSGNSADREATPSRETASAPATPPETGSGESIATADELAGAYRVAGVNGTSINLPHGITANIDDSHIELVSGCLTLAWSYFFEEGRLRTRSLPGMTCERARHAEENALEDALDAANRVRRTPSNGVELSGPGGSVTLYSQ